MHGFRPRFERRRRIVEARCAGAKHGHGLAGKGFEIDGVGGVGAKPRGQFLGEFRHPPAPGALLARGEDELAGMDDFLARRALQREP